MVVIHTVRLVGLVHNERGPLQGGMAHHAGEALGMVGVTSGLQHPVCDGLLADTALLQGASIAVLTEGLLIHIVELLPLQLLFTFEAGEAFHMEEAVQGPHSWLGS